MSNPPIWTTEQLRVDVDKAIEIFRRERLDEPLEVWKQTFDEHKAKFEALLEEYGADDLKGMSTDQVAKAFQDDLGNALRYMAGPPISADDLKVLADASLAPSKVKADPAAARRILDTIIRGYDSRRFPWVAEGRAPTESEKDAAILASTALITAQRVSTIRRNKEKDDQEGAVKTFLEAHGFVEVAPRKIRTLTDAPDMGEFCAECLVGTRKADVPVRLYDGRLMPIECKASNSATNSVKRVRNDAAVKAVSWRYEFGQNQVIPTAVISGVFKVPMLEEVQERGLSIFWAHDLSQMGKFLTEAQ